MPRAERSPSLNSHRQMWPVLLLLGALVCAQFAWASHEAGHGSDETSYACAWCLHAKPAPLANVVPSLSLPVAVFAGHHATRDEGVLRSPGRSPHPARAPPGHT